MRENAVGECQSVSTFMRADVCSVGELFSGRYCFRLPWFQRLYAWTEEQLERLMIDIQDAMHLGGGKRGYYLGNMLVAQREGNPDASIADGHQRLMTLTILISVLRDLEQDEMPSPLHRNVWRLNDSGMEEEPHLRAQSSVAEFLRAHVQTLGATRNSLDDSRVTELNDGERNIIFNRDWLVDRLAAIPRQARERLADFILQRCYITVCAVEEEEDARIIFALAQTRGLQLSQTDLFKAEVLGVLKPAARRDCGLIWERSQADLGPERFQELLGHVRSLKTRRLKRDLVEADLWRSFRLDRDAEPFIRRELPDRTEQYRRLSGADIGGGAHRDRINRRLQYLGWVTHRSWLPPAMHWLSRNGEDGEATLQFLIALDRLAYFNMIVGSDGDERDRRYLRILSEIDNARTFAAGSNLNISKAEIRQMRTMLRGSKLVRRRLKVSLMLRINGALEGDEAPSATPAGTIEHILPQSPARGSTWHEAITSPAEQARVRHMLGNLTVLLESENALADNRDYEVKRPILAASPFPISRLAARHPRWNAEVIDARTGELIEVLCRSLGIAD
jgi:hypothetical protein